LPKLPSATSFIRKTLSEMQARRRVSSQQIAEIKDFRKFK